MKPFKFVILLGKSGSGKGTQADFLVKEFGLKHLSTGLLLRKRCRKKDYIGKKLAQILVKGGLVPTPLVFHLWLHELEAFRKTNAKGAVFEGSPRKLYEAWMLKEVLEFYDWEKNIIVCNVKISDREALKRLLARGRNDDKFLAIKNRLLWFKKEVAPVVSFYRKEGVLIDIDGEQSVEGVYREIQKKLRNFFR